MCLSGSLELKLAVCLNTIYKLKRISIFIILMRKWSRSETNTIRWLWICIEPVRWSHPWNSHLSPSTKYVRFILSLDTLVTKYDKHSVNSDGARGIQNHVRYLDWKTFCIIKGDEFDRKDYAIFIDRSENLMITIRVLTTTIIIIKVSDSR